jgi:hypothetical protein
MGISFATRIQLLEEAISKKRVNPTEENALDAHDFESNLHGPKSRQPLSLPHHLRKSTGHSYVPYTYPIPPREYQSNER